MIKIMYLTTDQTELSVAMEYAKRIGISIYPKTLPESGEEYVRMCMEIAYDRDVDVMMAKGRTLAWLNKLHCTIPIVQSLYYNEETIPVLWKVRQRWEEQRGREENRLPRVALLTHQPLHIDEALYSAIFRMSIVNILVPTLDKNKDESFLLELKSRGFDYVVCGKNFRDIAERVDIEAFYILRPSSPNSIQRDLDLGKTVAQAISAYKKNYAEMQTVMNYAFEAMIIVEDQGKISLYNQVAEKAFQWEERMEGKKIWDVIPVLPQDIVDSVLRKGKQYYGHVLEYNGQTFVMNITPLAKKQAVMGAVFHFTELHKIENLEATLKQNYYSKGHKARYSFANIVGESAEIAEAKRLARQFAKYSSNVLIVGETGTGKELFAQSIHNASLRKDEPFVALNCGAIPMNLLESELFGYVDGAFTGASRKGKKGLVEIADHGTLFLDEISEMDLAGQVQLLRVLEERVIRRVGDDKEIPVDIRVIAASNKNLEERIRQGKFREDLYYRLNVLTLYIPPLREREDDIRLLARQFLEEFGKSLKKRVTVSPEAEEKICRCNWTGNVRQLKNFCERLVIVADQPQLPAAFVERQLADVTMQRMKGREPDVVELFREYGPETEPETAEKRPQGLLPLNEKEAVIRARNQAKGSRIRAAELLGISKTSLWRKMKQYGIVEKY